MNKKKIYNEQYGFIKSFTTDKLFLNRCNAFFTSYKRIINEIVAFHSGGGCCHMFFRINNEHIISIHNVDDIAEISYKKWDSINDYIDYYEWNVDKLGDDAEDGFGWESNYPNYKNRCFNPKIHPLLSSWIDKNINGGL